jgi:hypothetical protein
MILGYHTVHAGKRSRVATPTIFEIQTQERSMYAWLIFNPI